MARKAYKHGPVVVSFDPDVCIHSEECVRGLPKVFDPSARPWIRPENASADEIEAVVRKCPSGALEFLREEAAVPDVPAPSQATRITVLPNGPYIVEGKTEVRDVAGNLVKEGDRVSLCRCGQSSRKPFCDGTHGRVGFNAP